VAPAAEFDVYKTNTVILKDLVGAKVRGARGVGCNINVHIMPCHTTIKSLLPPTCSASSCLSHFLLPLEWDGVNLCSR
jgi:hypothetical protein